MSINRRGFLVGSTVAAVGLANGVRVRAADKPASKREAVLKLSSQLGVIPGKGLEEKIAKMEKWGFDGIELGGDIVGNEKRYKDAIKNSKLKYSAVCWGSIGGAIVSEVVEKRAGGIEALKKVLASAGELETTGVIYVPAFNGQTKLTNQEIRKILLDTFPAIGEYAVKVGSRVLFEPLNRGEAYFLRQLADGASICRDCKSPGICMMGDFYHMTIEETSDMGAFISAGDYLHHVHLASRRRVLPGQDDKRYVDGFRGLKMIGYQDYCSYECGCDGNKEVEIPKANSFLRDQWAQAVV
ncbi:MAG: sugar phosphate isomerase/epimerase family protein [Pirellulales bacterium]